MQSTTVAIVGCGMAGLSAARLLGRAGYQIVLYEKSRGVGGRMATRRVNGCTLDHGAQVIKPDGTLLADLMLGECFCEDLVQVTAPVRLYTANGEILPPDPERAVERQFAYRSGITALPKRMLQIMPHERVTLKTETRVSRIEEAAGHLLLYGETGTLIGEAHAVILTAPGPQSADLLEASRLHEDRSRSIRALRSVEYTACLTVLLGYAGPAPEPPGYALLAAERETPLLWLAFEHVKARERAPGGEALLIAQLGPEYSRDHYASPDDAVIRTTLEALHALFGETYAVPLWAQVKRWRYSQPTGEVGFDEVNPAGCRVVVCGDALRPGRGRVHQAFLSGMETAEYLMRSGVE
ncbi:MAG: FAD-dependent oxidoreductase [Chloroherpetonaceae bacterium]|nr:FAD-dependent oxidoreductase [Chthonomonadaceae bacterium]MDW8206361.1 FAD-dependent oxidoreductase [Chloroherpetonaceae bacterium]